MKRMPFILTFITRKRKPKAGADKIVGEAVTRRFKHHGLCLWLFIIIFCLSVFVKIQFLSIFNPLPLSGDAPNFLNNAKNMKNFYAASTREPFWILWTKIFSSVSKDKKTGMRTGNIILSMLTGILIFVILNKTLGPIYALAGSTFFLFIPYLLYSPIRAHRLEMYLFLLLLFTYLVLFLKPKPSNGIFIGIISSLLILVRMESLLVITVGIILFIAKKNSFKKSTALITLITLTTLAGPFFYNCYKEKGTPFCIINTHSKFYYRHEKALVHKTIPQQEALKHPYNAPGINITKYIFKTHSLGEIIKKFYLGFREAIVYAARHIMSTPVNLNFLIYPVWLGLVTLLFISKGRTLLLWGLLYILPHSFILSTRVVGKPSVDIRFAASVTPLLAFGMAGFCLALNLLFNLFNSKLKTKYQ